MKTNQNNQGNAIRSIDRSNKSTNADINILEPGPESDLLLMEDEDEDLLDYSLMNNVNDLEYDE